jgi:GT2 family glycosyltransferase
VTPPTLSLMMLSHQRPHEIEGALDSARGEPFDEMIVLDSGSQPPLPEFDGARLMRTESNVGIAEGRTRLADAATGDVLIFLDDDARLRPGAAAIARQAFADNPDLGALAFRIERPDGPIALEQPFRRGTHNARSFPESRVDCGYVIGATFAVRRSAYQEVGGADPRIGYGSDEIDLSLRLVTAGWRVVYEPAARSLHRPSPRGRFDPTVGPAAAVHNRLLMARANLPLPVAAIHAAFWIAMTAREAQAVGGLGAWRRGLGAGLRRPVERRPMSLGTMLRTHRLGGRVLY